MNLILVQSELLDLINTFYKFSVSVSYRPILAFALEIIPLLLEDIVNGGHCCDTTCTIIESPVRQEQRKTFSFLFLIVLYGPLSHIGYE